MTRKFNQKHYMQNQDGSRRVFHHGSNSPLSATDGFDAARVGSAHNTPVDEGPMFFFTDDLNAAKWYAHSAFKRHEGSPCVVHVQLNFVNLKIMDFEEQGIEYLFSDIAQAKEEGHDGLITLNYDDGKIINQFIAFSPDQIEIVGCTPLPAARKRAEKIRKIKPGL